MICLVCFRISDYYIIITIAIPSPIAMRTDFWVFLIVLHSPTLFGMPLSTRGKKHIIIKNSLSRVFFGRGLYIFGFFTYYCNITALNQLT